MPHEVKLLSFIYGEASGAKGELGKGIAKNICLRGITAGHIDTGKLIFRSTAHGALKREGYTLDEYYELPEIEQKRVVASISRITSHDIDLLMSGLSVKFRENGESDYYHNDDYLDPHNLKRPIVGEIAGILGHNSRIQTNAALTLVEIFKNSPLGICLADGRSITVQHIFENRKKYGIIPDAIYVTAPPSTRRVIAAMEVYENKIDPSLALKDHPLETINTIHKYIARRSELDQENTFVIPGSQIIDRKDGLENVPLGYAWNNVIFEETARESKKQAQRLVDLYLQQ